MIAEAIRRSALADYAERFTTLYETTGGSISIRELPFLAQLNLRVDAGDAAVMRQLTDSLGFSLPLTPNTAAHAGDRRALWLGPDEWLIVDPDDQATSRGTPSFRSFRATNAMVLRSGETGQFTTATDKVTGETVKVDVTLTVVK